uniref:Uncharacterized protein n=1 Tax=Setaria italica TaxID=4555 RepID=K3ZF46_SETIT
MDDETIRKMICCFIKRLNYQSPECCDYGPEYEKDQLMELYEQLALYRIKAYELTVDRKLAELDDVNLKLQYPPSKLYDNNFFKYYEESLEWYFDLERCWNAQFDNYQRLVLHGFRGYLDWDFYRSINNTYEQDLASICTWERIRGVAYMQALDIAAGFPDVSPFLVSYGFPEYICSILSDYSRKGLDGLYFEIWKRVAKEKMSFEEALLEIHSEDMFPLRIHLDTYVASTLNPKFYLDYARKKLDIAREIDLIPKGRRGSESLS